MFDRSRTGSVPVTGLRKIKSAESFTFAAMITLIHEIRSLAASLHPVIVQHRRHIHAFPELSFQEHETAAYIAAQLDALGIAYNRGVAGTGIVAIIEGNNASKKTVALRADMDALPITETNKTEYASKNTGVMHACGHDVHSAALIGAAAILQQLRDRFEGSVKLIFQPGEEQLPGGASIMIKEHVLENPEPQFIFAQHVYPSLPAGKAGFRSGMYMASTDELYVTVKGKGGHAAMPAHYNSPLLIAAEMLRTLQAAFMHPDTREIPDVPTVLAFGKITGNGATNVIPDEVKLEGSFRTMNEDWRKEAHVRMKKIAEDVAKSMHGEVEFRIEHGYPFLVNDESATALARAAAEAYLGKENVVDLDRRMTAEDFAFFSQKVPACFYRLGTASPDGSSFTSGVHTSTFDIDETALETGMGLFAAIALQALNN